MIKSVYFTGIGFTQIEAIENANRQADKFITESSGGRQERDKAFISFHFNGAVHTATLQLNYTN